MHSTQSNGESTFSSLNQLIETAKDGQNGFQAAANDCTDATLKQILMQFSRERGRFAVELQSFAEKQGQEAEQTGSLSAAVHRGWINLRSALSTRDNLAVLEECERGEDYAVQQYLEAVQTNQLGNAAAVVEKQLDQVQKAHRQIKNLRNQFEASSTAK